MSIISEKEDFSHPFPKTKFQKSAETLLKPLNINSFAPIVLCLLSYLTNEF